MNIEELKEKLRQEKIDSYCYCFDHEHPNEAYTINNNYGKWEVYYSERGNKNGILYFDAEREACKYLYSLIKNYK